MSGEWAARFIRTPRDMAGDEPNVYDLEPRSGTAPYVYTTKDRGAAVMIVSPHIAQISRA